MDEARNPMNELLKEVQYLPSDKVEETFKCFDAGTLANWRWMGKGPKYCRIGRKIYYDINDLHEFMQKHKVDPEG
jgi:hypothetical protein